MTPSRAGRLIPRRSFIVLLAAAAPAALIACGQQQPAAPAKPAESKPAAGATAAQGTPAETKPAADAKPAQQAAPAQPAAAAKPTGQIVVAQGIDPDTLDPHVTASAAVWGITLNIFDTLITRDQQGKLQPGLATSWRNVDDKTWEVKLRDGVRFHNGEPFDGAAVKFSIERVLDPNLKAVLTSTINTIEGVTVVDPLTVRIGTKEPDPLLPSRLSMQYGHILPPKYAQEVGADGLARRPVGAGPYKFVSWQKDEAVTLEAVEGHWRNPKIQKVLFKPIPEGAARVAALKTGAVDLAAAIPPTDFEGIKTGDRTVGIEVTSNRAFLMNLDTINFEPFKDRRVRQALNHAVDVDAIIKNTLNGYGKRLASSVIPEAFGYDPSIQPYPHDLDRAKALLAEAGYPNGFEVGLDSTDGRYPQDKEIATVIAGQLARVGINVKVQTFEWGSFYDGVRAKKRAPIHDIGMSTELFDPDNTFSTHFHSQRGTIWARWHNEEFNRLADQARSTLDENVRREALAKAQRIQHDEAPMIFLHQITYLYGVNKRVQGWQPTNAEPILLWDASVG
jgi:peptide/nickel transport system substrate-binding protein